MRTYNVVKNAIWACVLNDKDIGKEKQQVDMGLLRDLMNDIQVLLDYVKICARYERKIATKRMAIAEFGEEPEYTYI